MPAGEATAIAAGVQILWTLKESVLCTAEETCVTLKF